MIGSKCGRLSAVALAVAFGLTCALWTIALTAYIMHSGHGTEMVNHWASLYPGYSASEGMLIGFARSFLKGFVCGFAFGLVSAWIYNLCLCCCSRGACCCGKPGCTECNTARKCCCGKATCMACSPTPTL
jgi:hypothetical protein